MLPQSAGEGGQRKKYQRPGEVKKSGKHPSSQYSNDVCSNEGRIKVEKEADDDEIEEFIKTVEDDVLENKYSSSFEGNITSPQPDEDHVMSE